MTSIICMLLQRMLFGFVAALPLATTPAHPARAACEQMVRPPPRPALHCDSLEVARPARTRGASPAASPAHPFRPIHTGRIHSRDSRAGPDLASRGAPCMPHGVRPQLRGSATGSATARGAPRGATCPPRESRARLGPTPEHLIGDGGRSPPWARGTPPGRSRRGAPRFRLSLPRSPTRGVWRAGQGGLGPREKLGRCWSNGRVEGGDGIGERPSGLPYPPQGTSGLLQSRRQVLAVQDKVSGSSSGAA